MQEKAMKRMRAVESDSVKSAKKAKDKLHKACERASEILVRSLHRQKQNRMCMASMRESRDSPVSTHVQSHALMRRGLHFSAFHCIINHFLILFVSVHDVRVRCPIRQRRCIW